MPYLASSYSSSATSWKRVEKSCPSPLASGVGRRGIFLPRSVVIIIVSQEWGERRGACMSQYNG